MAVNKVSALAGGVIVVILVLAGATLVPNPSNPEPPANQQQAATTEAPVQTDISYQGIDGRNALELLKEKHQVQTKTFSGLGEMVTSINGLAADDKHFWAFYVNGRMAQVGAAGYVTKSSETIVWKLEEIK